MTISRSVGTTVGPKAVKERPGTGAGYWLMIAPAALLLAIFYVYPLATVLWTSVTEPEPGLSNYALLFTSGAIQRVLITTTRICLITTIVALVLGYVTAYALVHLSARWQRWIFLGVLLPFWVSVLARSFAWVTLLRREGLINEALLSSGLIDQPLALIWNELGITIGMVHYMLPYAILPLYANMRGIDGRVIAAARGLGATRLQAFVRVFLPLSLPGITAAGMLVFILSLGFYVTPAILGGGRTQMIAQYISSQILELNRWGRGTMLAMVLMLVILLLIALLARVVDFRRLFGAH